MTGLLTGAPGYQILSNRESGTGRVDLIIKSKAIRKGRAIVLEPTVAGSITQMEEKCREALRQIEEKQYEKELLDEGYPVVEKWDLFLSERMHDSKVERI